MGLSVHQLAKGRHLGPKRIGLALGLGPRGTGLCLAALRFGTRGFRFGKGSLGIGGKRPRVGLRNFRLGEGRRCPRQQLFGCDNRRAGPIRLGLGLLHGRPGIAQKPLHRLVPRGQTRHIFCHLRQRALALGQDRPGLARLLGRVGQPLVVPVLCAGDLLLLPFQPRDGLARIAVQSGLTVDVAGQLFDARLQRLDARQRLRFLIGQLIALHQQALQHRSGNRLFLAQGGQCVFGDKPRLCGGLRGCFGLRRRDHPFAQGSICLFARLVGLAPAAEQQQSLGLPQFLSDLAIARRLPRLTRQRGKLLCQLLDHVVHAGKVRLGRLKAQFCLVPPLVQARDACRFFQDTAAVLRLGVDEFGNLTLPHQRGRLRPGRGIGEQHLDVARAHFLGVGPVGRPGIARDASDDLDLVLIVEARRREAIGVVDDDRHFGKVARAPRRGTGKDHILHPAAAHRRGTVFAHHPTHRFEQVRLAAAVRTDNACQTRMDHQIRRVDKAFEAVQPKPRETHRAAFLIPYRAGIVAPGRFRVNRPAHDLAWPAGVYPQHIARWHRLALAVLSVQSFAHGTPHDPSHHRPLPLRAHPLPRRRGTAVADALPLRKLPPRHRVGLHILFRHR